MSRTVLVGAVVYDPKVVTIWEIIKSYFLDKGCRMDFVFYSNYELQAQALADGHIDIAWNSPLAWLDCLRRTSNKCRAIAMRDTDRDRVSHILVHADSDIAAIHDLKGRTIATGASDSPQATLIPLGLLHQNGLQPYDDFHVMMHNVSVGKHGDHVGGERDALESLLTGRADASCVLDLNWALWSIDGSVDAGQIRILATTETFDHCVFTVREDFDAEVESKWLEVLHSMDYENPDHQKMMDMEGLKQWMPGRTSGFGPLTRATETLGFFK